MADTKPTLDFVIVGAAKTGTTSLFEYLRTHPEVHLPKWKETNFFLDHSYQRGVEWYLDWVLTKAPAGAVCGEASVRYMAGTSRTESAGQDGAGEAPPPDSVEEPPEYTIPRRIHSALPDVKLIALLRDPVDRCISEYRMAVLQAEEQREVNEALRDLLKPPRLEEARARFSPTTSYVVQGEYGRILAPFFELFGRQRMLVLFTSELSAEPEAVVRRIWEFLGVESDFVPPNLELRYREGVGRPRVKWFDLKRLAIALRRASRVRSAWRRLPTGLRQRVWTLSYRIDIWNRTDAPVDTHPSVSPELEDALREHFQADRKDLTALLGAEPPWP
jgi:hypothetical protein